MANARKQMKKTRDDRSYQDEMEVAEEYDDFDPEDFEPLEKAASGGCGQKNKNYKNKNPCDNLIGKKGSGNRNGSGNKNCDRNGSGGRKKANGNGNGNGQLSCPKDNADQPKDDCDEIDSQNALCRRSDDNFSDCDCPQANPCKIDWKYSVGFQNFFCQYRKKFGGCQKPCKEMLRSAKNHYRDLCAPDKQDYRCGGTAEPDPCRVPPGTPEQ